MSQQLDDLKAQVSRMTTITQSAIALFQGLSAEIERLKDDPVQLQALADELRGDADQWSAAIETNTPTPPTPPAP